MKKLIASLVFLSLFIFNAPQSSAATFTENLKEGSRGSAVTTLQQSLYNLKYMTVLPTGYYGPITKKAVCDFQVANKIVAAGDSSCGIFGPKTRSLLSSVVSGQVQGAATTTPSYSMGMTIPLNLQQALINQGYLQIAKPTGYFGNQTYIAVSSFQKANSLPITGVLNSTTQALLLSACDPVAKSVTIISPNGGEVYTAGQQYEIAWSSCNIPLGTSLVLTLKAQDPQNQNQYINYKYLPFTYCGSEVCTSVQNVPTPAEWSASTSTNMQFGLHYKMEVSTVEAIPISDMSDNLFTINTNGSSACTGSSELWGYDTSTNLWTAKANFPASGRDSAVAFSIGDRGYVGTGHDDNNVLKKDFWEWNQDTNVWTQKANFGGTARTNAVGFSIGNYGYIGTGEDAGGRTKDFWQWDLATNTWSQKADLSGAARTGAVGFSIGQKGYIGTGDLPGSTSNLAKDFYEWDQATNTWFQKTDLPGPVREEAAAFAIASKGYIGTGSNSNGYLQDFYEWNQATNTWTPKANFGGGLRASAVGVSILGQEKGYLGTGSSNSVHAFSDFWEYDPILNKWTQKPNYGGGAMANGIAFSIRDYTYIGLGAECLSCTPNSWNKKADFGGLGRWQAEGVSIKSKGTGYIGMGSTNTTAATKDFWEWDQATNTWSQKAPLIGSERVDPSGFDIDGKIYTGTGSDGNSVYYNDFWAWDRATNLWTQKAQVPGAGRRSAVGFSIGSRGYLGTGVNDNSGTFFADLQEYNPATNSWTAKANFPGTARSVAVGFSIGNKGYVGTGATYSTSFNDFYEYDPATNKWTVKANVPGPKRGQAAGFSIGNYGYIGTGARDNYVSISSGLKDFYKYDPASNTWTQKADFLGTPRFNTAFFSLADRGYIGTGLDNSNGALNYTKDFYEYCPD